MLSIVLMEFTAIVVLAALAIRRRAQRIVLTGWGRALSIAGLILLGLQSAVFLLFGAGEMLSGDLSGAGHLVSLAAAVLLALLAWRCPLQGGIALLLVGLVTLLQFSDPTAKTIMAGPPLLSGALFLGAGISRRCEAIPKENPSN
ncbi:MAG: hypothetical protein A2Z37_02245 [Chloroflexi bacterium RBG_19FT_COMBO_62_14]|nr:MAG: hypothetical protein A2Z37_02245 [Chloroflexi bacterium RBG_19FT_COMBO_62_14]